MFTILVPLMLLPAILAAPYPFPNTTSTNFTATNTTLPLLQPIDPPPPTPTSSASQLYTCTSLSTSDLTVLNERYPNYTTSHLHAASQLFMLRRQLAGDGTEIASLVAFSGLPAWETNDTCRLEFLVPSEELQKKGGEDGTFEVWRVPNSAGAEMASWSTTLGDPAFVQTLSSPPFNNNNSSSGYFGTVNGRDAALNKTRQLGGGVAAVNSSRCEKTMSWVMRLKYDAREGQEPNYWEFVNVGPPAWPGMGWRVVWGC